MARFEDFGRTIDRELEKLHEFIETEVKPTTQRRLIEALRATWKRLAELAREVEASSEKKAPARKKK